MASQVSFQDVRTLNTASFEGITGLVTMVTLRCVVYFHTVCLQATITIIWSLLGDKLQMSLIPQTRYRMKMGTAKRNSQKAPR